MSHKLSTVQSSIVSMLTAAAVAPNILASIPIAQERFGQPWPEAAVNDALSDSGVGLCILSLSPYGVRAEAVANQMTRIIAMVPVILLENPTRNTGTGGANKNPLEVVEAIWSACAGAQSKGPQIQLGAAPLEVIGEDAGMRIYSIDFEVQILFKP